MSTDDKKINIDDITFDDVIGDGIEEAVAVAEEPQAKEPENVEQTTTETTETSLDDDAKIKQQENQNEGQVLAETTIETPQETKVVEDVIEPKEETSEEDTVVGQVLSTLGYETKDAYDDTPDGLVEMTKDIGAQIAEEQLEALFKKHPLVQQHLQYVMSGGQSQDFMALNDPRSDFSKINIKEDDVQSQKYVIGEYFKMKGHDDAFIKEILEDYEDSGKLKDKSKAAHEAITKAQQQHKQQVLQQQKLYQQRTIKEERDFWNGVFDTIDKSKDFKGITVPEREKRKFFDYLSKPVTKEGYTQRELDHNKSDMDVKLAIDYLMFKGFNLDKLISKKAKTKSVKSLKDRIKRHQQTIKSARKTQRTPSKSVDIEDLDLNIF